VAFEMDEEAFRGFYDRTARMLWVYLERLTGDRHLADDLLQDGSQEVIRADLAERPVAPADRRPHGLDDDDLSHSASSPPSIAKTCPVM